MVVLTIVSTYYWKGTICITILDITTCHPPKSTRTTQVTMRLFLLLCCLLCSNAFVQHITVRKISFKGKKGTDVAPLNISSKLLLFTPKHMANRDDNDREVNVNLIGDVDSFTLTAVGFGLIAFNFFVLANVSQITIPSLFLLTHNIFNLLPVQTRWETQG